MRRRHRGARPDAVAAAWDGREDVNARRREVDRRAAEVGPARERVARRARRDGDHVGRLVRGGPAARDVQIRAVVAGGDDEEGGGRGGALDRVLERARVAAAAPAVGAQHRALRGAPRHARHRVGEIAPVGAHELAGEELQLSFFSGRR